LAAYRYHVAHIIDSLSLGGAEKVVVDIANRLSPRMFDVHVIATTAEGPRLAELLPHVKYFYLGKKHRYDFRAIQRLISYLDENEIMIVHTHQQTGACFCAIACKLFRRRYLHVHSDHNSNEENWKLHHQIKRWLMASVHQYFPVAQQQAEWEHMYLGAVEEKQQILWNGVDTAGFKASPTPGSETIIQVAGLRPPKSLQVSIDTAKLLALAGRIFSWQVAGSWNAPPTLEQEKLLKQATGTELNGYFRFLGPVKSIPDLLSSSGIGVLTSSFEAMPIALCEYLAAGLPVVVSDIPIHREILGGHNIGLFAEAGNPSDFATKIAWIIDNPVEAKAMGLRAQEFARKRLDINNQVHTIERTYKKLIQQNKS
jgi:glycosyltransferase involved in cell wall biosynthesis